VVNAPSKPPPPWRDYAGELVAGACAHPLRFALWRAYKPISPATIVRFQFGVGRLPFQRRDGSWYWSRSEWLIVPLLLGGSVLGLRGRRLPGIAGGPKWISATGTRYCLWNVEGVRPGHVVWICENYVDAAWLMERYADWDAVALGGAANWRDDEHESWARRLSERSPSLVMVALDNDLAGQAAGATYRRLLAERRRACPNLDLALNGPKIAASLRAAGLQVSLFNWPDDAPAKADIGWLLAQGK
jgi:hypothetical protein